MEEVGPIQVEPSLYEFFIYNPKFRGKREEDEYMKILYFYPNTISVNRQCNSVGLAEALTNFTRFVYCYFLPISKETQLCKQF